MRIRYFGRPERQVVFACFVLSCRLVLFCLSVSALAEKATAAVNCGPLEFGLPLPGLPRLISGEGTECRWSGHSDAISSGSEKPSPGFWPVSVLMGSMEWLVTAWAGVGPQVLQPAQPEKRFSLQPLLSKSFLSEAEPTAPAREQRPEALRPFLIPGDLPPWQQQTLSEQWQQLQLSLSDVETQFRETGTVQLFIPIIDQHIRVALSSSKAASSQQLIAFNSALHELLLAIYQMMLEQEPIDDRQADDYSPMVSAAGGSDGDDGNNDDGFGQDDKLPDIILDFALLPGLLAGTDSDLLTLSILKQRSRLQKLRRRLARMTENGRSMMAAILRDRIMVIEADEEDLLNLAVSPGKREQKILPLLHKLLQGSSEDALMPAEYDYARHLRQAPGKGGSTPKKSGGYFSGKGASGYRGYSSHSRRQSGQASGKGKEGGNGGRHPDRKKTKASQVPAIICCICKKPIPKNKPAVINTIYNQAYCQKCLQVFPLLSLPEAITLEVARYLEWKDIIQLSSTCRCLRQYRQANPVSWILKPLARRMSINDQDAEPKDFFGTEKEITDLLGSFRIPEPVISAAIGAGTGVYLQALYTFVFNHNALRFRLKNYTRCPGRVICIQALSNGHFACGLGDGQVFIMNEELKKLAASFIPVDKKSRHSKKMLVSSISELSDSRLLVTAINSLSQVDKVVSPFYRAVDNILAGIALWDIEAGDWYCFPRQTIEPGISAMTLLPDHRLALYYHSSNSLHVWNICKGAERKILTQPMYSPVTAMLCQKETQQLFTGHVSGAVSIWGTGQLGRSLPESLITAEEASIHKLNSEHMIMKLLSGQRLATASPGHVVVWDISKKPGLCVATLDLSKLFDYEPGKIDFESTPNRVKEPVAGSWVELHDHRLAILLQWPFKKRDKAGTTLLFWNVNPDQIHQQIYIAYDSVLPVCPATGMWPSSLHSMKPLLGNCLVLVSHQADIILWQSKPGDMRLDYCFTGWLEEGYYTLEASLVFLSASRILTNFGGQCLCVFGLSKSD